MKKLFFLIAAVSLFVLFSCEKQITVKQDTVQDTITKKGVSLTVTAEDCATKAIYNGTAGATQGQFKWSAGDIIGVHAWMKNDESDTWPAQLTLSAGAGTTSGTFTNAEFDTKTQSFGTVAFFPWNGWASGTPETNGTNLGTKSDKDNTPTLWVHLFPSINYLNDSSNPQQLLPLAANITTEQSSGIKFKHLGAGLMVSLSNVPKKANKVSLTIPGKNITGWYGIEPKDIGTEALAASDGDNSTVSINFATTDEAREAMSFVFPLPTVSFKSLTIAEYCDDNLEMCSISASRSTDFSLERGQILDMSSASMPKTKTITIGVVNHITETDNWKVRYWDSEFDTTANADATMVAVTGDGATKTKDVGYWGSAQTFKMYTATIPVDAKFKVHRGDRWFGDNANEGVKTAWVFNYDGDKAVYE